MDSPSVPPSGPGPNQPLTDQEITRLQRGLDLFRKTPPSLTPLLPLLFTLNGKPYSLADHFPFEPYFRTRMPKSLLFKSGRQVSKCQTYCLTPRVWLADGRIVGTADVKVGDKVLSLAPDFHRSIRKVLNVFRTGKKPVFEIRTRLGAVLEHTAAHKVRTLLGYTPVSKLKPGDRVAGVRLGGTFGNARQPTERIILTALLLGDGSIGFGNTVVLTKAHPAITAVVARFGALVQDDPVCRIYKAGTRKLRGFGFLAGRETKLRQWLESDGLWKKYAWEKKLPDWVFQLPKEDTRLFLAHLWAADGHIKGPRTISYTSTSEVLANQLRSLLAKFGIPVSIKQRRTGYKKNGKFVRCRDAFIVRVETRAGLREFLSQFDVPGKPGFRLPAVSENNNRDTIPIEVQELLDKAYEKLHWSRGTSLDAVGLRATFKYPPSRTRLLACVKRLKSLLGQTAEIWKLENLLNEDVIWDEIVSIKPVGLKETCDFEIEEDHNFVLSGIYTHNSTSLASNGILRSNCIPFFKTLYVTPLFEMIRRFSVNYVKPFIEESPVRRLFVDATTDGSVLQRTFRNKSRMIFSFAYKDANRTRGISSDCCIFDEIQDMDVSLLPIILEVLSHSPYQVEQYAGTPKTLDNTIERLWLDSSMAEWIIRCRSCRYENVPALKYDLLKMIGPWHPEISEARPGTVCAKCSYPVNPREGRWVHGDSDKRWDFAGYHLPQMIIPLHYANADHWKHLRAKLNGAGNTPLYMFYNEVCGESYDEGAKLVTQTDLQRAAVLGHDNTIEAATKTLDDYLIRVLAVDWGAAGEKFKSFTTGAVLGLCADGHIDVIYGWRSMRPSEHVAEAQECATLMRLFRCQLMAHDFTGAGSLRETFLVQANIPRDRIIPVAYVRAAVQNIFTYKPATIKLPRDHWQMDKTRAILLVCQQIKNGSLRFYNYDYRGKENPGLLHDFLALIEEKIPTRLARENYVIGKDAHHPDDFVQAVTMGCCTIWHTFKRWPNIATQEDRFMVDNEMRDFLDPTSVFWEDI